MEIFFSEDKITIFFVKRVILYNWILSHFPVSRSVSFILDVLYEKTKDHHVQTTLARPSDCDVVLAADLFVGFSQNLVRHFFKKFVEHL
jgi:hypothetical protein